MQDRNRHIRVIERHGRREWFKRSGFTERSMVGNSVFRYKTIIGPEMRARTLAGQRVEQRIGREILSRMTELGMPDAYCVGWGSQSPGRKTVFTSSRATTPAQALGSALARSRGHRTSF